MKKIFLFILLFVLCAPSAINAQVKWKGRTKRSSGDGGVIKIVDAANRTAAEAALAADADAAGDASVVDIERIDSNEASYRGYATQATLALALADLDLMTAESTITANSSTTPLTGSATFTGSYTSIAGYEGVRITCRADQDSANGGLSISWSKDGTNTLLTQTFTVTSSSKFAEVFPIRAAYVKVAYTNGGVAQSVFDLHTVKIPRIAPFGTANAPLITSQYQYNGTTNEPVKSNTDITFLSSASRTTTQTGSDQTNTNARGIVVVLDITSAGTGSITLEVDIKDPASGKYIAILTGAAETSNVTRVYRVYPGLTAVTNATVSDILPRTFRVVVTANNANAVTYSVGGSLIQ